MLHVRVTVAVIISYSTAVLVSCAQRGTTECDNALIRVACRSLNLTSMSGSQPVPQACSIE